MLRIEDHGSLAVAFNPADERAVQRELQKLDTGLWLDKELDPQWGVYYLVRDKDGGNVVCCVWREDNGKPKPLTLGIIEELKRQRGSLDGFIDRAVEAERKRRERERERSAEEYHDRFLEHVKRVKAADMHTLTPYWRPKRFGAK